MTTVNVNIITKSSKKPKKKRTKKRSKRQPQQQRVIYPAAVQTGTYAYNTPIHLDPPFVEQSRLALNTLSSRIQEMKPDYDRIGKIEADTNRALADSNTINDTVTYMANNFSRLVSQEVKENMPRRPRPFDNLFDKSGLPKQRPKRLFLKNRDTTDTDTDVEVLPSVIIPPPPPPLVRETSTGSVKEIVKMMEQKINPPPLTEEQKQIQDYEKIRQATEKLEQVQQPKKVPSLEDIKNIKSESEKSTGRGAAEKSSSESSSDDSRDDIHKRADMGSTDYEEYISNRQERIKKKEAKVKPPVKEPSMKEVVDELAKKRELIKELPAPPKPPPSKPPPPKPPVTETPPKAVAETPRHPSGRKVRSDKGKPRGAYKKKDA